MDEDIYIDSVSADGGYQCIIETGGKGVWMYLHDLRRRSVIADSPVASLAPLMELSEFKALYRGDGPPPFVIGYCAPESVRLDLSNDELAILWGLDGISVAVSINGEPFSMIVPNEKRGYSKAIQSKGPWGNPWDQALYRAHFAEPGRSS